MRHVGALLLGLLAACGADGPPERPGPDGRGLGRAEPPVVGLAEAEAFALDPPL